MTGVILAGGRSRRFGADKARHVWRGRPLLQHVRAAVAAACDRVMVVGGPPDLADLPDEVPGAGPVAALATAFRRLPDAALFVTGCDLPLLTEDAVRACLIAASDAATDRPQRDAVVARTPDGRPQPLVAVYWRRCVDRLEAACKSGDASFLALLPRLEVRWVDIPGPPDWALNANRPDDLPGDPAGGPTHP